jgi:hypothetical protein
MNIVEIESHVNRCGGCYIRPGISPLEVCSATRDADRCEAALDRGSPRFLVQVITKNQAQVVVIEAAFQGP